MKYYLIYNEKIGEYLKNPKAGLWSTTNLFEAEDMLETATNYVKACGYKFLEGKLKIQEAPQDFNLLDIPMPIPGNI